MLDKSHGDGGGDFVVIAGSCCGGLGGWLGFLRLWIRHQIGEFCADFGADVRADDQDEKEHKRGSHAHDQKDEAA